MDKKPKPVSVTDRLKSQFTPAYLTLTSIIQGVALSALVVRVEDNYAQFNTSAWLLAVATFVAFLIVWQEYLMQALAFVWVPTLLDSVVPFTFLASELFMAHFVYNGLRGWLLSFSVTFLLGITAQVVTIIQARTQTEENFEVAQATSRLGKIRGAISIFYVFAGMVSWAFYYRWNLSQFQTLIALLALTAILIFLAGMVPYWNRVLRFAQEIGQ